MNNVYAVGLGMVTPLGYNAGITWSNLIEGKSGINRITRFDPNKFFIPSLYSAGEVKNYENIIKNFLPECYGLTHKQMKSLDMYAVFGFMAAIEALKSTGLNLDEIDQIQKTKIGIIVGTGNAGCYSSETEIQKIYKTERSKADRLSPNQVIKDMINSLNYQLSIYTGFQGASFSIATACASGTDAQNIATILIENGYLDAVLVIGAEGCLTPYSIEGFLAMRALSTRECAPEKASCPFSFYHDGFVMSEGAGAIFFASNKFIKKYLLKPLAQVIGYSSNNDANHVSNLGNMQARAMASALKMAKIAHIDYINAHGTSTKLNDVHETKAIKEIFGSKAYQIPISSTKSMTGHGIGATGIWESIFCILAIRDGIIPPTINLNDPDPECDLNYVPNTAIERDIKHAMNNSFGFGGQNAVIIFKKIE
jgi:3-oxoacyl-[acyl-carrier-protein] synthase II